MKPVNKRLNVSNIKQTAGNAGSGEGGNPKAGYRRRKHKGIKEVRERKKSKEDKGKKAGREHWYTARGGGRRKRSGRGRGHGTVASETAKLCSNYPAIV